MVKICHMHTRAQDATVVVGAGAAGLMAVGTAAGRGKKVILVEKNDRVGKKLLITGKGRCNITNTADIEDLINNIPGNGNFLYSTFYTFNNWDIINFFEERGLKLKTERGGRVFPESDRAKDVVDTLKDYALKNGVDLKLNSPVEKIAVDNSCVKGVILKSGEEIQCSSVVLATGGCSYPGTGSTGDGYKIARECGHTVVDLKPSLVPLNTKEEWVFQMQGLSLKNVAVVFKDSKGKKIYSDFGEMLFTHFGVSGPVVLSASRHLLPYNYKNITMSIDLKPALTMEKLDDRVIRDFEKNSRKQFKNSLNDLLPQKMIPVVIKLSGINPEKFVNQITKEERHTLINILKSMTLTIDGSRPISEAIITAGGVKTDEINPATMESKIVKGLFFAGEIIDTDGYTGGFNLTIAFSTGYTAGINC